MGRGKVNMELISNKRYRNTTFQKRKKGLKKKIHELSTLCGVDACMIVYGPYLDDRPMELDTWPPNPAEVHRIINSYKSTTNENGKRNVGISDYFEGRQKKIEGEIAKVRGKNREAMLGMWDDHIKEFSHDELRELLALLDSKVEGVKAWSEFMKGRQQAAEQAAAVAAQAMTGQSYFSNYSTQDLFQSEGYCSEKPLDSYMPIPPEQGHDPMLHFNQDLQVNPTMMMMMNAEDCPQYGGTSNSNNSEYMTPLLAQSYYNPLSGQMPDNLMDDNPRSLMNYYYDNFQPMEPYSLR